MSVNQHIVNRWFSLLFKYILGLRFLDTVAQHFCPIVARQAHYENVITCILGCIKIKSANQFHLFKSFMVYTIT